MATRVADILDRLPRPQAAAPVLRLVETSENRPMPPVWMVAPAFRGFEPTVREEQPALRSAPMAVSSNQAPYRSIREVPKVQH